MTDAALILGVLLAGGWDLADPSLCRPRVVPLPFLPLLLFRMLSGDVKLLAAIGALKGPLFVLWAFLYGALAGGVLDVGALLVG